MVESDFMVTMVVENKNTYVTLAHSFPPNTSYLMDALASSKVRSSTLASSQGSTSEAHEEVIS
jgi:hypothetical protein